jgi:hypothetical protein
MSSGTIYADNPINESLSFNYEDYYLHTRESRPIGDHFTLPNNIRIVMSPSSTTVHQGNRESRFRRPLTPSLDGLYYIDGKPTVYSPNFTRDRYVGNISGSGAQEELFPPILRYCPNIIFKIDRTAIYPVLGRYHINLPSIIHTRRGTLQEIVSYLSEKDPGLIHTLFVDQAPVGTDGLRLTDYLDPMEISPVLAFNKTGLKLVDMSYSSYDTMMFNRYLTHHHTTMSTKGRTRIPETSSHTRQILLQYGPEALRILPPGFHVSELLGTGGSGVTYLVCKDSICLALKYATDTPDEKMDYEIAMMVVFARVGLLDSFYRYDVLHHDGFTHTAILMGRVDYTLTEFLDQDVHISTILLEGICEGIVKYLQRLCQHGMLHGDAHFGNIGLRQVFEGNQLRYAVAFFDYGQSRVLPWSPTRSTDIIRAESVQLCREPKNQNHWRLVTLLIPHLTRLLGPSGLGTHPTWDMFQDQWDQWLGMCRPTRAERVAFVKGLESTDSYEPLDWIREIETDDDDEDYSPDTMSSDED